MGGSFAGWPMINGSLGPLARSVTDMAKLLDVLVGYDPEDPETAAGAGRVPPGGYTKFLDKNGLKGARIGILRDTMGYESDPSLPDFARINAVFDRAVGELKAAGATVVDPVVIPNMKELLAKRAVAPKEVEDSFKAYFARSAKAPFKSFDEMTHSPDWAKVWLTSQKRMTAPTDPANHYQYLMARDQLMFNVLKVMADNKLDAIVYRSNEHEPTLIKDGIGPPWVNQKGSPHLNTFLIFVPVIAVPAGFTTENLPAGITFMGAPYTEATLIKLAYSYEQATHHRVPPKSTPAMPLQQLKESTTKK
jgi:Asp-tRNA(Asn)/Glu-tRNA(Gln) amidotransferase A subunit family amidase